MKAEINKRSKMTLPDLNKFESLQFPFPILKKTQKKPKNGLKFTKKKYKTLRKYLDSQVIDVQKYRIKLEKKKKVFQTII